MGKKHTATKNRHAIKRPKFSFRNLPDGAKSPLRSDESHSGQVSGIFAGITFLHLARHINMASAEIQTIQLQDIGNVLNQNWDKLLILNAEIESLPGAVGSFAGLNLLWFAEGLERASGNLQNYQVEDIVTFLNEIRDNLVFMNNILREGMQPPPGPAFPGPSNAAPALAIPENIGDNIHLMVNQTIPPLPIIANTGLANVFHPPSHPPQ